MGSSRAAQLQLLLLVALVAVGAARLPFKNDVVFDFGRRPDVVKQRVGEDKLQRMVKQNPTFAPSLDALVEKVAKDDDLVSYSGLFWYIFVLWTTLARARLLILLQGY